MIKDVILSMFLLKDLDPDSASFDESKCFAKKKFSVNEKEATD